MDFTKDSIELSTIEVDLEMRDSASVEEGASPPPQTVSDSGSVDDSQTVQELSAWEKWIVKKALVDRTREEQERLLRKKEAEAAKALRKAQREKKRKSEQAYREWLADKAKKKTTHTQEKRSTVDLKERLEDIEKKEAIEDRSKTRYNEWRARKRKEKIEREKLLLEEQHRQAALAREKRERGEKAYRDWMRVNYDRQLETNWHSRLDEKRTYLHSRK